MNLATIFSGIGTAEYVAPKNTNIIFGCEIDKFARKVYLSNIPNVQNFYEDITQTNFLKHKGEIDLLVGGSPCQSFSKAGGTKRI